MTAMDYSRTAVQKARDHAKRSGLDGIEWEVADIQAIPRPANHFDTVISCETIEHVPDPRKAISELIRVLKPGGRLFLTTPNYLGIMGLYRIYYCARGREFAEEGQPKNNVMMLPKTRWMVSRADAKIVYSGSIGHYFLFPRRVPKAIPALDIGVLKWLGFHSIVVAEKRSAF
jgi:2-polyprenyl-3-methyl-5-hydroxy-6-metoxy-1,4-benzoquinol methylase